MSASLIAMALLYVFAGSMHFVKPGFYLKMMPPYIPAPRLCVYLSGLCEIACGVLLMFDLTRTLALWGIIALLIAVFPANLYMAQNPTKFANVKPIWLWARLPLQIPLIVWAYLSI